MATGLSRGRLRTQSPRHRDGTFQTAVKYAAGSFPMFIAVTDLNRDGKADIVVTNQQGAGGANVSVFLANGDGTFQTQTEYTFGINFNASTLQVADIDADG